MTPLPVPGINGARDAAHASRVVTTLGVRFLDLAVGWPVTSGLIAFAYSLQVPAPPVRGVQNPSGTFGFHDLPGVRGFEHPTDGEPVASPPHPTPFLVVVADRLGRFLPALFTVDVPFVPPMGSPPEGLLQLPVLDAPLLSAPTRAVPTGFAAVRAELWDRDAGAPLVSALVKVVVGDRKGTGVSDQTGQVLVMCPAPVSDRLKLGSPPGSLKKSTAPAPQTWPTTVKVFSSSALPAPPALPRGAGPLPEPWSALTGLRAILDGQPRAQIWTRLGGPSTPSLSGELTYGRDLILRTTTQSRLWISRGASPP